MNATANIDVPALLVQIRAAQQNSRRYQWLLDKMSHQQCGPNVGWTLDTLLPGDDPDQAIAAAMTAEQAAGADK